MTPTRRPDTAASLGADKRPNGEATLAVPPEWLEAVAERAAELVAERQSAPADDGFLDAAGAAEFLSCPKSRLYKLASTGRVPVHRDGSRLLFDRSELREFVRNGGATSV